VRPFCSASVSPHSAYRLDFADKPLVDVWGFLSKANVIA
jgi:hypothetical protein